MITAANEPGREAEESDGAARARALDPRASFIVQAPAGSGKTTLLTQRYLALLAEVDEPEEITAITFTRKAAAEMRHRVMCALRSAARGDGAARQPDQPPASHETLTLDLARRALARDRERGWQLDQQPRRLGIQTIDAFALRLAAQHPDMTEIVGGVTATDDAQPFYEEAARRLAREESPAWERVLRHFDNELGGLQKLLADMLARRDQWLRHVQAEADAALRAESERAWIAVVESELAHEALAKLRVHGDRLVALAAYAVQNLTPENAAPLKQLAAEKTFPSAVAAALGGWRGLAHLLLTDSDGVRKPKGITKAVGFPAAKDAADRALAQAMKDEMGEILGWFSEPDRAGCVEQLKRIKVLPDPAYENDEWLVVGSILTLLKRLAAHLAVVFREEGKVDHIEVTVRAIRALEQFGAGSLRHLLVDEFQDTSVAHVRLFELAMQGGAGDAARATGKTLFLVGDPMQSIYRFREAEVGNFLRAWRERRSGKIALEPITLRVNFRSDPALIEELNRVFARVLPLSATTAAGSVPYTPFAPGRRRGLTPGKDLRVTYRATLGAPREEVEDVLALVGARLAAGDKSIAFLARTRNHAIHLLIALRAAGIPYRAVDFEPLGARPIVRDLRSTLAALMTPTDRIAWLSLLRAPWCGLALSDLLVISEDANALIADRLKDSQVRNRLSEDGRARLARAAAALEIALNERERGSWERILRGLWLAWGGPALADAAGRDDAERFFRQVREVEEAGILDEINELDRALEHQRADVALDPAARVEIMTIHKAKGLEFDTVILPSLGKRQRPAGERLIYWDELLPSQGGAPGLLLAALKAKGGKERDAKYDFLKNFEKEREGFEQGRLSYVAATRARERLHLIGALEHRTDGSLAPRAGSLLKVLWPGIGDSMMADMTANPPAAAPPAVGDRSRPPIDPVSVRRVRSDWVSPLIKPTVERPDTGAQSAAEEFVAEPLSNEMKLRAAAGRVLHALLLRIARDGIDRWSAERLQKERPGLAAALAREGVAPELADAALADLVQLATNTLADERGRWILAAHSRARSELPLAGLLDGKLVHLRLDRTFVDQGERWLVDFKSSKDERGNLEQFLREEAERHRAQIDTYRQMLTRLDSAHPVRAALYFPRYGRFIEI